MSTENVLLNTTFYLSLKNKNYTSKKDFMNILRENIKDSVPLENNSTCLRDLLTYYVDCIESKVADLSGLIEFPRDAFSGFVDEQVDSFGDFDSDLDPEEVANYDFESYCLALKMAFEKINVECDIEKIREIMKKSFDAVPMRENEFFYVLMCMTFDFVLPRLNDFYRNLNSIPIVKLFCEGKNYKVNGSELLKTLKKYNMDANGIEEEVNQMTKEGTFDFKELFGKLDKEVMKQIEFVKIPESSSPATSKTAVPGAKYAQSCSESTTQFNDATSESERSTIPEESSESSNQMESTESSIPEKKKKAKKTKKLPEPKIEKQVESKTCPKCYRSSEFTRKTNEKLRLSKIENKQLKKELTKIQLENEEKEETIRMLKAKLEEQEMKLQKVKEEKEEIKKELEEKKVTIEVMEAEKECVQATNSVDVNVESQSTSTQTTPICSSSFSSGTVSEEAKDAIFNFLTIRNTLQSENPIQKSEELINQLSETVKIGSVKQLAEEEKTAFQKSCNLYVEAVNSGINQLISNLSTIPKPLPEFPTFSKKFQHVFKMTIGSECPPICESLLVVEDPECLICLIDISEKDETVKCGRCTKKYHVECAREWFKVKRTCPTCREGMVDDNEFPSLS